MDRKHMLFFSRKSDLICKRCFSTNFPSKFFIFGILKLCFPTDFPKRFSQFFYLFFLDNFSGECFILFFPFSIFVFHLRMEKICLIFYFFLILFFKIFLSFFNSNKCLTIVYIYIVFRDFGWFFLYFEKYQAPPL